MKLSRQRDLIGLIYPIEFFYGHDQDFNQRMILIYPDVSHRSVHSSTVRWNMFPKALHAQIERRGENYRQRILTQSLQMHYRFVIHLTSLRQNSKAKIPTKEFDVNAGKIRPVAFWTTPETRKTGTALKDRYDALFIRALASAVMVITISLLTPAKNYHLVRLIPRFPSFALIAHFTVGSERTLKELKDDFVQLCGLILFSSTWQLPMR